MRLIRRLSATRPDPADFKSPVGAAGTSLKRLAKRYVDPDDEASGLDEMIEAILADAAPLLVKCGCVAQSAARLMVAVGDDPERLRSEAAFAMLCGVAPIPVSSGMTCRHRLNRGGDRQASSAIHVIAIGRPRADERTEDYAARKTAEGHTEMEAIRCLKRYIAREMHCVIKKQRKLVNCSCHLEGHQGAGVLQRGCRRAALGLRNREVGLAPRQPLRQRGCRVDERGAQARAGARAGVPVGGPGWGRGSSTG